MVLSSSTLFSWALSFSLSDNFMLSQEEKNTGSRDPTKIKRAHTEYGLALGLYLPMQKTAA
jgi:hypothetical protein